MGTTIEIDDELLAELKERARRENVSLSDKANEAIREGLRAVARASQRSPNQRTYDLGKPLIDLSHTNAVLDELETEEFIGKMKMGQ